jgi:cell division protein ZapB
MTDTPQPPAEQELQQLELRLTQLLAVLSQVQEENRALRQRQDAISAERSSLLQKNEQVRARVEAMIGRLRTLEQGA